MKKFSILFFLLFLFSCKKDKIITGKTPDVCDKTASIEPALTGKWKLVRWSAVHYNTAICQEAGGNWYNTSDWGTNAVLEILPEGIFRTFQNDSLTNESFVTNRVILDINNYGERYNIACGNLSVIFANIHPETDSLHTIQIGDTLMIRNPFLNINFTNHPNYSITWRQYYVKIE